MGLYSIVNFPQLLDILSGNKLLGKAVEYVHCYIKGKIEDWENPSENEVFDRMVLGIGIVSPYEFLQLNTDYSCVLHSVSLPDYPIYRDKDLQYHIEDTSLNFGLVLGACNEDGIDTDYLIDFPDLACIWPSQYGFARCLSRQGIWGFIRMEDFSIRWLDKSVIYADDFLCERARITYQNRNIHCFNYVDLCLNPILNIPLNKAGHFVDGIATVGDEYCDSYRINVFGKIIEEDKERYQNLKNKHIQAELESKKRFNDLIRKRRNQDSYDPESEIMNSLTGHGADPEIFGF